MYICVYVYNTKYHTYIHMRSRELDRRVLCTRTIAFLKKKLLTQMMSLSAEKQNNSCLRKKDFSEHGFTSGGVWILAATLIQIGWPKTPQNKMWCYL